MDRPDFVSGLRSEFVCVIVCEDGRIACPSVQLMDVRDQQVFVFSTNM